MKRVVVGLIVAIVLLVAVDFVAASAAEYQLSSSMRSQLALSDDPAVKINGFPFLLQAALGDYQHVEVTASNLTVGQMSNVGLDVQLYHVRVPLSKVLSGAVRSAQVESVQGAVLITKLDLARQLPKLSKLTVGPIDDGALDAANASSSDALPGSSVVGINPDSAVRIAGTVSILGRKTDVSAIAVLQMVGPQIQITARDIRVGSPGSATVLPEMVQSRLRRMFTFRIDPGTLPFDVTPTRLRAVGDGVEISGVAKNLVLGASATQPSSTQPNN